MGSLVSGCLGHRPLLVIDRKYMWMDGRRIDDMVLHIQVPPPLIEKVLLVAGEAHSGNTMRLYYNSFLQMGAKEIRRTAFYVQKGCTEPIEYIGLKKDKDFRMPWMFTKDYIRDSRSKEEAMAKKSQVSDGIPPGVKQCFVVRHGESINNASGDQFSGVTDSSLTEEGINQANAVGRYLQQIGIQRIFSSPMKRAVATAREIQSVTGGHLVIDQRLREIDYGEWEGVPRNEVLKKWPELYAQYKRDPVKHFAPAGENPKIVSERIMDFWNDLQQSPATREIDRIAIVTHNTVARILLTNLSEEPLEKYRERQIDNASITKLLWDRFGKTTIVTENFTEHLRRHV